MKKLYILIIILSILPFTNISATHYMGGEITWECLSNGNYRFVAKMYRECGGINYGNSMTITVANHPSITQFNLTRDTTIEISYGTYYGMCPSVCNGLPGPSPNTGGIEMVIFTSDSIYPTGINLPGVPPSTGWIFSYWSCCRNPSTNLNYPTNQSHYIKSVMYPYLNQNASPCFDNSPAFADPPLSLILSTPQRFSNLAIDTDLDSLYYEWTPALSSSNTPAVYNNGYSYTSPFPGPLQNANNVAATIDPNTGMIECESYTMGAFVYSIKVSSFRCGVKIAEVNREFQTVILGNPFPNNPPDMFITAPGIPGLSNAVIYDTANPGDTVSFTISAIDLDTNAIGNFQLVTIDHQGLQFGDGDTSFTTGCPYPPCAVLNPPLPSAGIMTTASTFTWPVDCNHLHDTNCVSSEKIHYFQFSAIDSLAGCPSPELNFITVGIVVRDQFLDPPDFFWATHDSNGIVKLKWNPPADPDSIFESYMIYRANNANGPFTLLDSMMNYHDTVYVDSNANGFVNPKFYKLKTKFAGCNGNQTSASSPTLGTLLMNISSPGGNVVNISWNTAGVIKSSGYAYILRSDNPDKLFIIDSTLQDTYTDMPNISGQETLFYQVKYNDNSGIAHTSDIKEIMLSSTDIGVTKIIHPNDTTGCAGYDIWPKIRIRNFGSDTITGFDVSYKYKNNLPVTESWTGVLLPSDSLEYIFNTSYFTLLLMQYYFIAFTDHPDDINNINDSCIITVPPIGIKEDKNSKLIVYQNIPNPTSNSTIIPFELKENSIINFAITNTLGEIVMKRNYSFSKGKHQIELKLDDFPDGIYYYSIQAGEIIITKKLIYQK